MTQTVVYSVEELRSWIDWLYFFHAWQFPSNYASLTKSCSCQGCRMEWTLGGDNPKEIARRKEALKLYEDALNMLRSMQETTKIRCRIGIFNASTEEDDIIVTDGDLSLRLPMLRQQHPVCEENPNLCLADFIKPATIGNDKIGIFATSAQSAITFNDSYREMLIETLGDRLAEAAAEKLHQEVRTAIWAYAPDEKLTLQDILAGKYQGIRPAVGYPSLPDQSIIFLLDKLINLGRIGIQLTVNGAMKPHGSTCGLMFAHPKSRYFSVGKITEEQLEDYARRRGLTKQEMQKFLASQL